MAAPSRDDRLKPTELIVLSAVMAVFTGVIVLMTTRNLSLGLIFAGIIFIVALVVLAMLALMAMPKWDDDGDKRYLDKRPNGH